MHQLRKEVAKNYKDQYYLIKYGSNIQITLEQNLHVSVFTTQHDTTQDCC